MLKGYSVDVCYGRVRCEPKRLCIDNTLDTKNSHLQNIRDSENRMYIFPITRYTMSSEKRCPEYTFLK